MPPVFAQIRKESTREKVYAAIREAILSGRLKTGQRISEVPLAAELQVSRAIVREALLQLVHEGLVEQNAYKGTRVVLLTPEQVEELLAARQLIELEVVRLAYRRLTAGEKEELLAIGRRLDSLMNRPEEFIALDLELHHRIWEASGNKTLAKVLHQITAPLFAMGTIIRHSSVLHEGARTVRAPLGEHLGLVRAICEGTEAEAVEAMRRHIDHTWMKTREVLRDFLGGR